MSDPTKEKIDFEKESQEVMCLRNFPINTTLVHDHKLCGKIERWGRSIAQRVEEQTIQRCQEWRGNDHCTPESIPRIYAQQTEPEDKWLK